MLKKRIIPCLDIKKGRTVKGINFLGLRDAGDPVELARKYANEGADELVFLDITASQEERGLLLDLIKRVAREVNIPFTIGGGIRSLDDVSELIKAGADKVSVNSSAVARPELLTEIANEFGSQCLVLAIDCKNVNNEWKVFVNGGRKETDLLALEWAKFAEEAGAGEILLTSMNNDGCKEGFALDITAVISEAVNIPVIASGGAGSMIDFKEVFDRTEATGALAASIFHFGEIPIGELKTYLLKEKIAIRR